MSYIKIQKIKKENVETPEKGYIYLGYDDESVEGVASGLWVKNDDGTDAYYVLSGYATNPIITSISPSSVSYIGDSITIYGNNFVPGNTNVSFNGTYGTSVNVLSLNQLTVVVPNVQGTVNIIVTTTVGSSEAFPYTIIYKDIKPIIFRVDPQSSASIGSTISITGSFFVPGATDAWFNGVSGITNATNATFLTTVVPDIPTGSTVLFLRTQYGSSLPINYTIEDKNIRFTNFYPSYGYIGDTISISGANFAQGQVQVRFGDTQATDIVIHDTTHLTAKIASGTPFGSTLIRVDTISLSGFTVSGVTTGLLPTITSILPLSASIGDTVTVTGSNFNGTIAISFSNEPATIVTKISSTSFTVFLSSNVVPGVNHVNVTNKYGTSNNFKYTISSPILSGPIITMINPLSEYSGRTVNINGSNFLVGSGNQAYFGGIPVRTTPDATSSLVKTALEPRISSPIPTGLIDTKIVNINGSYTMTGFTLLTYGTPPTITKISPVFAKSGDVVDIYGTNLTDSYISFGTSYPGSTTSTTVISDSHVVTTVPSGFVNAGENKLINVYAITTGGTCKYTPFEVYADPLEVPNLLSFTPTFGTVGTLVTMSGYSFAKYYTDSYINLNGIYIILDNQTYISNTEVRGYIPNTTFRGATSLLIKTPAGSDTMSTFTITDVTTTTTTPTPATTTTTTPSIPTTTTTTTPSPATTTTTTPTPATTTTTTPAAGTTTTTTTSAPTTTTTTTSAPTTTTTTTSAPTTTTTTTTSAPTTTTTTTTTTTLAPTTTTTTTPATITIGFDSNGNINLGNLGTNVISISLQGTAIASQSWINCDFPPTGYANFSYYIGSPYITASATESSATSSNKDVSNFDTDSYTFTNVSSSDSTNLVYSLNSDGTYCGDGWGEVNFTITNITKTSGPDNIVLGTSYWYTQTPA